MTLSFDSEYCLSQLQKLLSIDSTTGQFREIQNYLLSELARLGFPASVCRKGGVIACLGGEGNALAVAAHLDDIGLMVRKINDDGTLNVCAVGGLYPFYCITENVRVYTRSGKTYTGTVCRTPNSIHVTEEELRSEAPDFRKNVCIVLDHPVHTSMQTRALGMETGDMIALEPRFYHVRRLS
jgi:putative aminopeptidase FrvX